MLKKEWGVESNENLPHLFIPSKAANLVLEFAVEDLPLDRTPTLVPVFAVKDLPLGRTLDEDDQNYSLILILLNFLFPLYFNFKKQFL